MSIGLGHPLGQFNAPAPPRQPVYQPQYAPQGYAPQGYAPQGPFAPGYQQNQPALDVGLAQPPMHEPFSQAAPGVPSGPPVTGPPFQSPVHPFSHTEPVPAVAGPSSAPSHAEVTVPNELAPPGATPASNGGSGAN